MYYLIQQFFSETAIGNLFHYITFRVGFSLGFSMFFMLILMPKFIKFCNKIQNGGQPIRDCGPETHLKKKGTPTGGGIMIVLSTILGTLFFADLTNKYIFILIFALISFCIIGFIDDYKKLKKKTTTGLMGRLKLLMQFSISLLIILYLNTMNNDHFYSNCLTFPFLKNFALDLGFLYTIFRMIVITGSSNAVNLTDGLDGLATMPVILNALVFMIFSYLIGNKIFSEYLFLNHQIGVAECCIFLAALIGACFGFLWYNANPAQIFMGDAGSLALGGILGVVSVIIKNEIILGITGLLFVIEAISVILQVYYFKLTKGKRIFLMAPIHHHFEKSGWSEMQVVIRSWIFVFICCLIALASIKLR